MTPWHRWFMKQNDLVFRRIGRLKSKHSYLKNLELPPTHRTGSQFLIAKWKQHQSVQLDFCRIFTGKKHPPCPKIPPQPPKKSLVCIGCFLLKPTLKNPTKPPRNGFSFEATNPPPTEPWWLSQYHRTWQASTNGRSSRPRRRQAWGRGRPYWRKVQWKGHDGWEQMGPGGYFISGDLKCTKFSSSWKMNSAWFFLWDQGSELHVEFEDILWMDPCHASLKGNWGFVAEGLRKLWSQ